MAVMLGCDAYLHRPPAEARLLALPGALADPHSACQGALDNGFDDRPHMAVHTLAVPWNLLGSPRRPAPPGHGVPVQVKNLWLDSGR